MMGITSIGKFTLYFLKALLSSTMQMGLHIVRFSIRTEKVCQNNVKALKAGLCWIIKLHGFYNITFKNGEAGARRRTASPVDNGQEWVCTSSMLYFQSHQNNTIPPHLD